MGDAPAAARLGFAFERGQFGFERNVEEANRLFRRAWRLGNKEAGFEFGLYYAFVGEDRAPAEALRWFRKAEDKGGVEAAKALADIYRNGNADLNVEPNAAEAERWRRVADGKDAAN